jgi:simple sugar transport system permease protein
MMQRKLISGIIGILIALLIGALIMLVQGYNPIQTYAALFNFSLFGFYPLATHYEILSR